MNLNQLIGREGISALAKSLVFIFFTGGATFLLMNILANGLFRPMTEYKAVFNDTTNAGHGDDVRIAGVSVGTVKHIDMGKDNKSIVTFGVDPDVTLTKDTELTIRYRNIVGQRYFVLTPGDGGSSQPLEEGDTIPLSKTQEALDLNLLFQGFKPVFQALSPGDTNKFAFEVIQTLQGETGTVQNLLGTTASLTSSLAERDQLIGDVIVNLGETLNIVANRDAELGNTIDSLQAFVSGLNQDRDAIFASIDSVSALSGELAALLKEGRPQIVADIAALRAATAAYSESTNLAAFEQDIQILPYKYQKITNMAASGSEFNFYLCSIDGSLGYGALSLPLDGLLTNIGGARCGREG